MTLAYWKSLRTLEQWSQSVQKLLATFLENCHQSTIWVGHTEIAFIRAIEIQETHTEVILRVEVSDIQAENVDIQVTQETVLIRGSLTKQDCVEGYFCPDRFQNLIPLPCPVHPGIVRAELQQNTLILKLLKKPNAVQPYKVQVNLTPCNPCLFTTFRAS